MRRVRAGEIVAGVAGLALLVVLFLEWYTVAGRGEGLSAWDAFTVVDVLLALVALLGIAVLVSQVAGRGPAVPVALEVLTTTLALAATLLVLYRILNQPGSNDVVDAAVGAWLGAACCLALFLGAWLALRDERARPSDPPPPEPERRPTPARS
jgi:carbon starvation protein CstA